MLYAFDSLYVTVAEGNNSADTGIYRLGDTDGDDQFDTCELLFELEGGGEHGPHNLVVSPDGTSLHLMGGNGTALPDGIRRRLPVATKGIDRLMPGSFESSTRSVEGWVLRFEPDGGGRELITSGLRNSYDLAFNRAGDLFTFDSDGVWDLGTPWYRPTRICHLVSGGEFGWRGGSAMWPEYVEDSVPPVVNIGPGSPTGMVFGYGANFPAKYQNALFACDWTFATIHAIHLRPHGASYRAEVEEFVGGAGLPVTDMLQSAPRIERMHDAVSLLWIESGWTKKQRRRYFESIADAVANSRGGHGYREFWRRIREAALEQAPDEERAILEAIRFAPAALAEGLPMPKGPGRNWTLEDAMDVAGRGFQGADPQVGREKFAAVGCVVANLFGWPCLVAYSGFSRTRQRSPGYGSSRQRMVRDDGCRPGPGLCFAEWIGLDSCLAGAGCRLAVRHRLRERVVCLCGGHRQPASSCFDSRKGHEMETAGCELTGPGDCASIAVPRYERCDLRGGPMRGLGSTLTVRWSFLWLQSGETTIGLRVRQISLAGRLWQKEQARPIPWASWIRRAAKMVHDSTGQRSGNRSEISGRAAKDLECRSHVQRY